MSAAALVAQDVTQQFGTVTALDRVNLEVGEGEFLTMLGPSGCGKTTLLRIFAGFQRPTAGRVLLAGVDVTNQPPHKRELNMVFQRATLFPNLDVFENIAFALRIKKVDKAEVVRRVGEALELVRLLGYERRRAHELSGGQMQRISLARALVNRPKVLLLDEPLSALDLKVRLEMEVELRRVHRETGASFVYVTHDQREALALSDRVAVFDHGHIEQLGTAESIYRRPTSAFAARFVGDANVIPAEAEIDSVVVAGACMPRPSGLEPWTGPAHLVVRAEAVRAGPTGTLSGTVSDLAFRGSGYSYRVWVPGLPEPLKVEAPAEGEQPHLVGDTVHLSWDTESVVLLRRTTEETQA